jgi:septal ring factor EnvC (AmiA/AmiB activator)
VEVERQRVETQSIMRTEIECHERELEILRLEQGRHRESIDSKMAAVASRVEELLRETENLRGEVK